MMTFILILFLTNPYLIFSFIQRPGRNPYYRWAVLPQIDNLDVCNSQTCLNTSHTICRKKDVISNDCKNFALLPMEFRNIQKFVLMHNGLRNRIVRSKNGYAKNMNYLVSNTYKQNLNKFGTFNWFECVVVINIQTIYISTGIKILPWWLIIGFTNVVFGKRMHVTLYVR